MKRARSGVKLWKYLKTVDNPKCNWIWNANFLLHFNVHVSDVLVIRNTQTELHIHISRTTESRGAGKMPTFSRFLVYCPSLPFAVYAEGANACIRCTRHASCQGNALSLEDDHPRPSLSRWVERVESICMVKQFDWICAGVLLDLTCSVLRDQSHANQNINTRQTVEWTCVWGLSTFLNHLGTALCKESIVNWQKQNLQVQFNSAARSEHFG